jgi:hypothetical protein
MYCLRATRALSRWPDPGLLTLCFFWLVVLMRCAGRQCDEGFRCLRSYVSEKNETFPNGTAACLCSAALLCAPVFWHAPSVSCRVLAECHAVSWALYPSFVPAIGACFGAVFRTPAKVDGT